MNAATETTASDVRARERVKKKPLLSIEQVSKEFDGTYAVDSVNLQIYSGEIFALLGASGSGKSTLLRILAGFELPTAGRIRLDGQDLTGMPPYKRPINMMFQSYALFPHMTVEQNLAFGLRQDRLPRAEIKDRVGRMLDMVQMKKFARRKPHQLSGGQRQRVALARSLAKQPKMLLLDEPMGALDKKLRTRMQLEVVDILESVGVTCVMVTHDQEEAMTMADRLAIMDEGRIEQVGTPVDVYESPTNRMVAEFIGSVNIIPAEIQADEEDHMILRSPELPVPIYIGHGVSSGIDQRDMLFALRPEKTILCTEQPEGDYNWAAGTVNDIAYLGGHSVYHVKLDSGRVVQTVLANRERRSPRPTWEDRVWVCWESDAGVVLRD
ncbi:polyamine ABC transporter ATP-binding protein [Natronospirillum operosum]|uniref:Spermidine/putrescine import ATP-binding protein PotA n=1 Tax=Natronospirillum operosum TaxID=2759953 RepID=A0A4Z0W7D5_9GAMM|nr:polyamine ABC transporter ATP-binding protein [Natronospirillum operosum]TGG91450.1 polyamine ABC transporter ATP-binding protein [Natronospirillum operosum]